MTAVSFSTDLRPSPFPGEFGQHTLGWHRSRLGYITGSRVGCLRGRKRGSDDFSDTAMGYIYEVAATRYMNNAVVEDDGLFSEYLDVASVETKAMRWGTEQEPRARNLYRAMRGCDIIERGSVEHPSIEFFASSPDGYIPGAEGNDGCIEIKCPGQSAYMRYRAEVKDNETLRKVKPEYYDQCQSHMMCTGAAWCDFIAYNPYQRTPIHIVRIWPDIDAMAAIEGNVRKANAIIETLR